MSDIHCVTTWSRYDNQWEGLATRDLLDACRPRDEARFVVLHSHDGYTTNLALEDFAAEDALLAHSWSGQPLEQEHGGPVRLVVPHLYFWKSAKWLQSIEFLEHDAPGYWEVRGYHNRGDPWAEQSDYSETRSDEPQPYHDSKGETCPCRMNAFNSPEKAAISSPPRWIRRMGRYTPMRCLRIASPAARTCWRRSASRPRSPPRASRVLRFDFTGLGSSEGDFANSTFSSNVADLVRAADHLRETREAPAILIGHSLGGAAILAAAGQIPDAKAVVTIAAPSDPAHVTHLFKDRIEDIRKHGEVEVQLAGRPFHIKREFLDDIAEHGLMAQVAKLHKALLVMHSPTDDTVGIDNATKIFVAAKHPKSFVSLSGADHLLSGKRDAAYVADVIAAWAERYVEPAAAQPAAAASEAPRNVVVRETRNSKFQQTVTSGPHQMLADEPVAAGGQDSGPGPYDFVLAGLGACTSMTMRMYADRKSLPLDRVTVTLKHSKIHAEDCAECETREGMLDQIDRVISIEGALDADQRKRLMEIADKCPVHRTLTSEMRIVTKAAD